MNVEGKAMFSILWLRHRTVFSKEYRELAAGILGTVQNTLYVQR